MGKEREGEMRHKERLRKCTMTSALETVVFSKNKSKFEYFNTNSDN